MSTCGHVIQCDVVIHDSVMRHEYTRSSTRLIPSACEPMHIRSSASHDGSIQSFCNAEVSLSSLQRGPSSAFAPAPRIKLHMLKPHVFGHSCTSTSGLAQIPGGGLYRDWPKALSQEFWGGYINKCLMTAGQIPPFPPNCLHCLVSWAQHNAEEVAIPRC